MTHRRTVEQKQPDRLVIVVQVVCGAVLEVRREGHVGGRGVMPGWGTGEVAGAGSAVP